MNKRIILSLGTLAFLGAALVAGTGAFFSDTETSTGNVFTAGDVTLSLGNLTHTYLADEPVANLPANYVNIDGNTKSFQFSDLKPLDWGAMDGDLTNGSNDALVCARVVDTNVPSTATSPFQDLLKFRVNNGLGLTAAQTFGIAPLGQWFSLNPLAPALAMAAGETLPAEVQYCFGDFVAGTPGDCVLNPAVDYNLAQNQSLTLDIEYYAVQARNNGDFTCADLNPEFELTEASPENEANKAAGTPRPYFNYSIDGTDITFELVNPRGFTTYFDYQVDGETGSLLPGIIPAGPLAGQPFGEIYNSTPVPANSTTTIVVSGTNEIRIGIHFGPENDDYLDWATFTAN